MRFASGLIPALGRIFAAARWEQVRSAERLTVGRADRVSKVG
jgi:hypothetical protein